MEKRYGILPIDYRCTNGSVAKRFATLSFCLKMPKYMKKLRPIFMDTAKKRKTLPHKKVWSWRRTLPPL